jgi:hypothetical protein
MRKSLTILLLHFTFMASSQVGVPTANAGGIIQNIVINNNAKIVQGGVNGLMGVEKVYVVFDYSKMAVCQFSTENEFFEDIRKTESKEDATVMIRSWPRLHKNSFEPMFLEYFNKHMSRTDIYGVSYGRDSSLKLVVEVLRSECHTHKKVKPKNPFISVICTFYYPNGDLIVKYYLSAYGAKPDARFPYSESVLKECYARAGTILAKDVSKELKKLNYKPVEKKED